MSITNQMINRLQIVATMQNKYGLEKYGKELDHTDNYGWLEMAIEEMVDGLQYIQCEMNRKNDVITLLKEAIAGENFMPVLEAIKILEIKGTGK